MKLSHLHEARHCSLKYPSFACCLHQPRVLHSASRAQLQCRASTALRDNHERSAAPQVQMQIVDSSSEQEDCQELAPTSGIQFRNCHAHLRSALGVSAVALGCLMFPASSWAASHTEPGNALSLPTWAIHVSSVLEWLTAMGLFWRYADVTGNQRWKGFTWGMMPLLAGALSACTYHFFYNSPEVEFMVVIQASLTVIGNATLWWAAYRVYTDAQSRESPEAET